MWWVHTGELCVIRLNAITHTVSASIDCQFKTISTSFYESRVRYAVRKSPGTTTSTVASAGGAGDDTYALQLSACHGTPAATKLPSADYSIKLNEDSYSHIFIPSQDCPLHSQSVYACAKTHHVPPGGPPYRVLQPLDHPSIATDQRSAGVAAHAQKDALMPSAMDETLGKADDFYHLRTLDGVSTQHQPDLLW